MSLSREQVSVDDDNVYLSVEPETTSGGWVTFTLTPKKYSGDLDLVFGFDREVSYPSHVQLWNPRDVVHTRSYAVPSRYFKDTEHYRALYSFKREDAEYMYDGELALELRDVTTYDNDGGRPEVYPADRWTTVYRHRFDRANKKTRTIYWDTTHRVNWQSLGRNKLDWTVSKHVYQGIDKWFNVTSPVSAGKTYTLRIWVNVVPSLRKRRKKGKYWVAVKPAGESVKQAIGNNHFYALDPWYDTEWSYKKAHGVNAAAGAGANYQVKFDVQYGAGVDSGGTVYLDGKCNTDFSDLRFLDDDESTLLDYWVRSKTDGASADVWVEVADSLSTVNREIYLYYGNSSASSVSNGVDTFLDFDDFEDGTTGKWVEVAGDGTISMENTTPLRGSYSVRLKQPVNNADNVFLYIDTQRPAVAIGALLLIDARIDYGAAGLIGRWDKGTAGPSSIPANAYVGHIADRNDHVRVQEFTAGVGGVLDTQAFTVGLDTEYNVEFRFEGTDIETQADSTTAAAVDATLSNGVAGLRIVESDTLFDNAYIRSYVNPEPAHGAWGPEETAPVPGRAGGSHGVRRRTMPIRELDRDELLLLVQYLRLKTGWK